MKVSTSQWLTRFGLCITLAGILTTPIRAAGTENWPDSFGTVVIGDLPGLLDRAGELAAEVSPGMNADMLKMQVGSLLRDPKLEGIPPGSGILAIIPESGPVYGFVELNPEKARGHVDLLTSRGLSIVKAGEGLYAFAISGDAAKEAAKEHGKAAAKALEGKGEPTVVATIHIGKLLKRYKGTIEDKIKSLPEEMATLREKAAKKDGKPAPEIPDSSLKMLPTLLRFYYAMAKRIDTAQLTIRPSKDGVYVDKVLKLVGGMSPARKGGRSGSDLLKLLPGGGAMDFECTFDPKAWATTLDEIFKEVGKESDENSQLSKIGAWVKDYLNISEGAMAGRMLIGDQKLTGAYAIAVTDEAKARALLADMPEKMKLLGLSELYKSMGMTCAVNYKAGVREHAGVKIDELSMKVDVESSASADMKRAMSALGNQQYSIAVVNKILLYAAPPENIDGLIDAAKSGKGADAKPLMAETKLPAGGSFYMDYNIAKVMQLGMASLPAGSKEREGMEKMFASVGDSPLLLAGYHKTDTLDYTMLLPAEMIKAVAANIGQMAGSKGPSEQRR